MPVLRTAIYQYMATPDQELASERLDGLDAILSEQHEKLDLIVCPELFISGYDIGSKVHDRAETADGPSAQRLVEIAIYHKTAIAAGYPEKEGDTLYNSLIVIGPNGKQLINYRKRLLPPGFEVSYFTPGTQPGMLELGGWKIATLICYDAEFPEYVRQAALAGADAIIVPTALGAQWGFVSDSMLPTRAFENGLYVLYANHAGAEGNSKYLGRSVIIAPDGQDLIRAGNDGELITATLEHSAIDTARKKLPYLDVVKAGL